MAVSKSRRYVYMRWQPMIDPRTKRQVLAMVACSNVDREILRRRKFPADGRVRIEIKNTRNAGFHRLVHVFGMMLVDHVDAFSKHGEDWHAAVKDIQAQAGAECDIEIFKTEAPGFGLLSFERNIPRSISFDEMDEDRFQEAFKKMVDYAAEKYWPDLTTEQVAEFEQLMERPE